MCVLHPLAYAVCVWSYVIIIITRFSWMMSSHRQQSENGKHMETATNDCNQIPYVHSSNHWSEWNGILEQRAITTLQMHQQTIRTAEKVRLFCLPPWRTPCREHRSMFACIAMQHQHHQGCLICIYIFWLAYALFITMWAWVSMNVERPCNLFVFTQTENLSVCVLYAQIDSG